MVGRFAALAASALLALTLGACGDRADEQSPETGSTTLTVYASLPLQGVAGRQAEAIANGARLSLQEAGGRVGAYTVKLVVLDDSRVDKGRWDGRTTADNARRAVSDKTTIAYLGDMDPGATAIALPLLNAAGILQVSPTSSSIGLTQAEGADKGEPEKYYPSARRTFGRVIPADDIQAEAQADALRRAGCARLHLLDDRGFYGRALASAVQRAAGEVGVEVIARDSLRDDADPAGISRDVAQEGADCAFFGASAGDRVAPLLDALHAADPELKLFAPDALAFDAFTRTLSAGTQARLTLTLPALDPGAASAAARDVAASYRRDFGIEPPPVALLGYEAMEVILASVAGAGDRGGNRRAVTDAFFALRDRDSIIGRYSITPDGDTTLDDYAQAEVRSGEVRISRVLGTSPDA